MLNEVISKEIDEIKRDKDSLEVLASSVAIATENPDVLLTSPILKTAAEALERRVSRLEELMGAAKNSDLNRVLVLYTEIVQEGDR